MHKCHFRDARFDSERVLIDDHPLGSREEADECLRVYEVETTPRILIGDEHVDGNEALRKYLGSEETGHGGT